MQFFFFFFFFLVKITSSVNNPQLSCSSEFATNLSLLCLLTPQILFCTCVTLVNWLCMCFLICKMRFVIAFVSYLFWKLNMCKVQIEENLVILVVAAAAITVILLLLLSHFSRVWLFATPQTVAHQASPSLGFSRQEHWSGLPFPSPILQ